jgi:xanthine dehydrogenase YagR molybdenum-binding subunit
MGTYFFDQPKGTYLDRVDGKAKVTGTAKYSAEYDIPGVTYGVMVGSTITKGSIINLDTKAAERAPGVLLVLSHFNAPKLPGNKQDEDAVKPEIKK